MTTERTMRSAWDFMVLITSYLPFLGVACSFFNRCTIQVPLSQQYRQFIEITTVTTAMRYGYLSSYMISESDKIMEG